jgi:hypothetical protein
MAGQLSGGAGIWHYVTDEMYSRNVTPGIQFRPVVQIIPPYGVGGMHWLAWSKHFRVCTYAKAEFMRPQTKLRPNA